MGLGLYIDRWSCLSLCVLPCLSTHVFIGTYSESHWKIVQRLWTVFIYRSRSVCISVFLCIFVSLSIHLNFVIYGTKRPWTDMCAFVACAHAVGGRSVFECSAAPAAGHISLSSTPLSIQACILFYFPAFTFYASNLSLALLLSLAHISLWA